MRCYSCRYKTHTYEWVGGHKYCASCARQVNAKLINKAHNDEYIRLMWLRVKKDGDIDITT